MIAFCIFFQASAYVPKSKKTFKGMLNGSKLNGFIDDGTAEVKLVAISQSSVLPIGDASRSVLNLKTAITHHDLLTGKTVELVAPNEIIAEGIIFIPIGSRQG
jgi:hypothetical protein